MFEKKNYEKTIIIIMRRGIFNVVVCKLQAQL